MESNSEDAPYTACVTGCLSNHLQVHRSGQLRLPPSYHSFVVSGRYDGPDAPAMQNFLEMFCILVKLMHAALTELNTVQGL